MNYTTARAALTVVRALLGPTPDGVEQQPVTSDELRDALATLADEVRRHFLVGPDREAVREAWTQAQPLVMTARQRSEVDALAQRWATQPADDAIDDPTTEPGTTGQHAQDAHDVEADEAADGVRGEVAAVLGQMSQGLAGLVRDLDREAAEVLRVVERSNQQDPKLIGQLGALSECRTAIAALVPDAEQRRAS